MKWYYIFFALQTIGATVLAAWLLYHWEGLFSTVKNPIRRDIRRIVLLAVAFYSAFMPGNLGWNGMTWFYTHPLFAAGAYFYISFIAVATYLLHLLVSRQKGYRLHENRQPLYSFLLIALTPFVIDIFGQRFIGFTGNNYIRNISYSLLVGCFAALLHLFFRFYSQKKEVRIAEVNTLKIQAELDALQSKINPHFLYNALSGLAGLALEDGRKASRMATGLSHLFRYNLNKEQQPLATVEEEIEMTETYLGIEKIRFEDALQVSIKVDAAAKGLLIPRFLLQPLVENCIKHAFINMKETGNICLTICQQDGLKIEVRDNGQPFPETVQNGYGMYSIRNKLVLLFPQRHQLVTQNQPYKAVIIHLQTSGA